MIKDKIAKLYHILPVAIIMAIVTGNAASADISDQYPNYYAARLALERGDCKTAVSHLQAYLKKHSYIERKYPDHYFEIKLVLNQCQEKIILRGVEGESDEIAPLPDNPPMMD